MSLKNVALPHYDELPLRELLTVGPASPMQKLGVRVLMASPC